MLSQCTRTCIICDVQFVTTRYAVKMWGGRFCSRRCKGVGQTQTRTRPVADRFWEKVNKLPGDGCWEWISTLNEHGYGVFAIGRRMHLAHRVSWAIHDSPITDGLFVCHHCDNRKCVRPDHLFLGTNTDNMRDCAAKGRVFIPMTQIGSQHHHATLSDEQVSHIRSRYATGTESYPRLAREFGVSESTIWRLVNHRVRKPVSQTSSVTE